MSKLIRVMVADDHSVVRQGLVALINRKREMKVVAEAADGRTAIRQFERYHPDVCLIDLRMPGIDGVEAIRSIRQKDSNANIIVLTTYDDDEDIFRALRSGAKAYLLKDITREELFENILAVYRGKTFFPARVAIKLAARNNSKLTIRELEVLRLLSNGKTNKEIGNLLGLKEGTIKIHINHILHKLGADTRTEASRIALKKGLISLD